MRWFVIAAGLLFGLRFVEGIAGLFVLSGHIATPIFITGSVINGGMALWAVYVLLRRPSRRA